MEGPVPSRIQVRPFEPRDAEAVAALFTAYMNELFAQPNALTADILLRDGQGKRFHLIVAVDREDRPIGFAGWREDYDLHNAVLGGQIADLFVARPFRGHALAIRIVAAVGQAIHKLGGVYLKGDVLTDDFKRMKLLRRLTVGFPAESVYVSGRALRQLAALADADLKTLVKNLPAPAASREP
jgi:GNAT superfamily N-acetyltransferase